MSDDPKPLTVREEAEKLLSDGTDLRGLTDVEIKRHITVEFIDHAPVDPSEAYCNSVFTTLVSGDPRMAQIGRLMRKKRLAVLAQLQSGGQPN